MRPNVLKNLYGEMKTKKCLIKALFAAGDLLRENFPKLSLRFCIARNWDQGQLMARAGRLYQPQKFSTFWRKVRKFVPKSTSLGNMAANFGYEMRTFNPYTGEFQNFPSQNTYDIIKIIHYFLKLSKGWLNFENDQQMFYAILELAKIYTKKITPNEGLCSVDVIDYNGNRR